MTRRTKRLEVLLIQVVKLGKGNIRDGISKLAKKKPDEAVGLTLFFDAVKKSKT